MPEQTQAVLTLPPHPRSAADARRFVDHVLAVWRCPDLRDTAQLLVSELVTNSVRHAGTPVRLTVRRADGGLRVEVADGSKGRPRPHLPDAGAEAGRGLFLLDQLARAWGVRDERGGKAVWFELDELRQAVPAG